MNLKKRCIALISMFLLMLSVNIPLTHAEFFDIKENNKLYKIIEDLEKRNIITPQPKEYFRPDDAITKKELSEMLMRSIGVTEKSFIEVPESLIIGDYDRNKSGAVYVYKMVQLGIITPQNDNHKIFPENRVKRIEALEMIFEAEGVHVPIYVNPYNWKVEDIRADAWMAPTVARALELELLPLDQNNFFNGFKPLTRAEAAQIIYTLQQGRKIFAANGDQQQNTDTETTLSVNNQILTTKEIPKIDILVNVYQNLLNSFLYKDLVDKDQLIYDAIQGMLGAVEDPYTSFVPGTTQIQNITNTLNGKVSGIGVEITTKDNRITVISPYRDSPGERAGLKANDQILKINGKDATSITTAKAAELIRGKKGTYVELYIRRPAEDREFIVNIQRDEIDVESVKLSFTDNIAVVSISLFRDSTARQFAAIADEIATKSPKGIILDLRNNPGGFLNAGVDVASHFIPAGQVVTTIQDVNYTQTGFLSGGDARLAAFPVVVLINEGTASSSEIVTEALVDYGVAKTVGTTSTGKGTVQSLLLYKDDSEFKLTVAQWLTPLGRSINHKGRTPDYVVVPEDADVKTGIDKQLEKAKEIILSQ